MNQCIYCSTCFVFVHLLPLQQIQKHHEHMWSSQLFNHNEAAIELQIGPSSINKQEWDTQVITMFYHFLAPEGGHPTWEENSTEKYTNMQGPFFLSHTSKLNQQKQWDIVSNSTAKMYPSNKYNIFLVLLLTNHETPFNLKILCWASTHLLSQSLPFLQLQVCDLRYLFDSTMPV